MQLKILALTALISSSAYALPFKSPYEFKSVDHAEAWKELTVASAETGTPEPLRGIWWMNGNPLPDELVSFAGVKWEAIEENGEVVGWTGALPVYDSRVWTWHDDPKGQGRALYEFVLGSKLVYVAQFNKDFTYGVVTPTFNFLPKGPIKIEPSKLLTFAMTYVADGEYSRDSLILFQESQYRFRRVIDENGQKIQPVFDEFLAAVETPKALIPVCKEDKTPASLPSKCVKK